MMYDNIVEKTEVDFDGHVSTGVLGIQQLMRGLTEHGNIDLAYKIVTNETYPSWGYMVNKGATTIWELWNGDTADPAMNSWKKQDEAFSWNITIPANTSAILKLPKELNIIAPMQEGVRNVNETDTAIKKLRWVLVHM